MISCSLDTEVHSAIAEQYGMKGRTSFMTILPDRNQRLQFCISWNLLLPFDVTKSLDLEHAQIHLQSIGSMVTQEQLQVTTIITIWPNANGDLSKKILSLSSAASTLSLAPIASNTKHLLRHRKPLVVYNIPEPLTSAAGTDTHLRSCLRIRQ